MNQEEIIRTVNKVIDFLFLNSETILHKKIVELTKKNNLLYKQNYAGFVYNNKTYIPNRNLENVRLGMGTQILHKDLQDDFLKFFDYVNYQKDKKQIKTYLNSLLNTLPEKHKFFGLIPKIIVNHLQFNFIDNIDYKVVLKDTPILLKQFDYVIGKIYFYISYNIYGD
jgi:hypothetical protein